MFFKLVVEWMDGSSHRYRHIHCLNVLLFCCSVVHALHAPKLGGGFELRRERHYHKPSTGWRSLAGMVGSSASTAQGKTRNVCCLIGGWTAAVTDTVTS